MCEHVADPASSSAGARNGLVVAEGFRAELDDAGVPALMFGVAIVAFKTAHQRTATMKAR